MNSDNSAIRKVQENQVGLKLNGILQLLVITDVDLLKSNIEALKKNTETFIDASEEVDLEENAQKSKYIVTYLFHEITAEPQKQPFLSNTRTQQ
jgi:hypothetical protein